jgi:hypothetical protein
MRLGAVRLLALALLVSCADPHRVRGAGSGSSVQSSGDLKVMLLLTDDLVEIQQRWAQPSSPTLDPINAARVGDTVSVVLIFTGCAADSSGGCRLVADVTITDPRGAEFKSERERPVCFGRPPPPPGQLQLAQEATSATVTHGPRGTYAVSVIVHDRVSGTSLNLATSFLLQ